MLAGLFKAYCSDLFFSWWAGLSAILTVLGVIDFFREKPLITSRRHKFIGALILVFVAQFSAYRDLYLRHKQLQETARSEPKNAISFTWTKESASKGVYSYRLILRTDRALVWPVLTLTFDGLVESLTCDFNQNAMVDSVTTNRLSEGVFQQITNMPTWQPDRPIPFSVSATTPLQLVSVTYTE